MNLYCETILNIYTLKNRKVLCQIKVNPKSHQFKNTCRHFSEEQWIVFDQELEKLLMEKDYSNNEKCIKFNIKPYIEVVVQKSKLSYKHLCKLLDAIGRCKKGDVADVVEHNIVLECLIDFQLEAPLTSLVESQEYDPQIDISPNGKLCSPLSYEPYTPSKKKSGENKLDINKNIEYNEDTYSPKPIFEIGAIEPHLTQGVPKYTPAPINAGRGAKENNKFNFRNDVIIENDGEFHYSDKNKPLKIKLSKKLKRKECEYIPKSQEVTRFNVPIYIPTPIQETTRQSVFKPDNKRQNKKRSNTIDGFPEQLEENIEKKHLPKVEQLITEEKNIHCHNRKLKNRSMTIDEIPAALADVSVYIPTSKEDTRIQEFLETCKFIRNKNPLPLIDVLLDENIKENYLSEKQQIESQKKDYNYGNKNLKKRSMTIDAIPIAFKESDMLHKSKRKGYDLNEQFSKIEEKKTPSEKTPEKLQIKSSSNEDEFTASLDKNSNRPTKSQTMGNDIKLEDDNKSAKNIELKKLTGNSSATDSHLQKAPRRDRKMELCSSETTKSFRRSERSPSKPKRLIEEQPNFVNKNNNKKIKSLPKNIELFGTDDDDDDDEHCFKNNNMVAVSYSAKTNSAICENDVSKNFPQCNPSSSQRKRKKDKDSESEKEKRDIYKKLFQKKTSSIDEGATKSSKATNNSSSSKFSALNASTKLKSQKSYKHDENYTKCVVPISVKLLSIEEKRRKRER